MEGMSSVHREKAIEVAKWRWEQMGRRAVLALKKKGYNAEFFLTAKEAERKTLDLAASAESIGVGGSITIRQLNILDNLKEQGKSIFDIWTGLKPGCEEDMRIKRATLTCDLFLASVNALTLKGEIVDMDGAGNRTNATTFGPKKVVLLVGINKLVKDIDEGLRRIQEVAAPLNCRRGSFKSPCYETGICASSAPGEHVCCITLILNRKPRLTDISVFVIGEVLGL